MRLFDTARRAVVPVEPRDGRVTMYVCGITPYDSAHLGHAFVYHVFDVLARRLRADGARVTSVRNVTDVDDDILRVARERGVDFRELADEQVARFDRDMHDINLLPVTSAPRATHHVAAMVRWIADLEARGCTYTVDGWVFFDTRAYGRYGELSRLPRADMVRLSRERGGRPDDPRLRDPLDFVLWQPSAAGEPAWPSPWGDGRPGWHIECSVLATQEAGRPVDIHGGGDDLVYPHHEAELAQARGADVDPFVRHWVHVAMVQLDGVKMSKSLGNLVFVRDLLARGGPATVRLLLAAQHHREAWSYDEALLEQAAARRVQYERAGGTVSAAEAEGVEQRFLARIDDDLDTPGALRVADELVASMRDGAASEGAVEVRALLGRLLGVFGVSLSASR